jgi:S1-C subfamily serine protease
MMNKVFIGLIAFLVVVCGGLAFWSSDLNGRINTLNDDTQAFKADTAGQFSTVESDISSVDSSLTSFKSDTADKFTGVESDVTGVRSSVTSLNTDLSTFKSDTTSRFESTQDSIDGLSTNLTNIGTQLDESTMNVRRVYDDVIGSVCQIIGNIGTGSGFIYGADGYIVTCWHVVNGQSYLDVILHDGTCERATVIGSDRDSDVAVLKVYGVSDLKSLPLADSSTLVPGEPIIVVGSPLGIFETVVYGIISRTTQMVYVGGVGWVSNLIQYDAAQNPGNSGGPVFNRDGQVIGIADSNEAEGVKYAISSNKVKRVADAIIDHGSFTSVILPGSGFFDNLTPEVAIQRGLDNTFGVILTNVQDMGQVQSNDIIVAIDGVQVKDFADLFSYIAEFKSVGDTVVLSVISISGTEKEVSLTLVEGWVG